MAGRASVFSDPSIIDVISSQFVPVAENSSALERQADAKGEFFRHVAEQGHYGGRTVPTGTRQGNYAFTADGSFLGSINSRDPTAMTRMLRLALDRFADRDAEREPPPVQLVGAESPSDGYPDTGLVLHVVARDLPREMDTRRDDWRRIAWNQDFAWIWRDEVTKLVPALPETGASITWPDAVVHRLARFHLRDFVRGEPFAWPPEAIRSAAISSRTTHIQGDTVHLEFAGHVRLESEARFQADVDSDANVTTPDDDGDRRVPCGFVAEIAGGARWSLALDRFTAFDLLATGPRWGANKYNSREDDLGPAPLGIAFGLAGSSPAERTAPHAIRTWIRPEDRHRDSGTVVDLAEYRS